MRGSKRVSFGSSRRAGWAFGSMVGRLGLLAMTAHVPGLAAAHTLSGSLGSGAAATDYYQIVCSDDGAGPPESLTVQIQDAAPAAAPLVSVQVRAGLEISNTTDPIDGDLSPSVAIHVNGGPQAIYDVLVDKSAAGTESYVLTYHCLTGPDGTGLHTGTTLVVRQNQ